MTLGAGLDHLVPLYLPGLLVKFCHPYGLDCVKDRSGLAGFRIEHSQGLEDSYPVIGGLLVIGQGQAYA